MMKSMQFSWSGVAWIREPRPPPDALGCAAQLLSPADSDGSDSFQWWPPVLTPIRLGDSGKLALAPHISASPTQQSRGEKGGGGCNCREPVSTFNFCFSQLRFATDLKFFIYNLIFSLLLSILKCPLVTSWHLFKPLSLLKTLHLQQCMIACNRSLMDGI